MALKQAHNVALLVESSRSYGRDVLRGIARFARSGVHWSMRHHDMQIGADPPSWLFRWNVNGILARIESQKMVDAVTTLGVPTIDLRCLHEIPQVPRFETDDIRVVQIAIQHFLKRGFRNFAFCGFASLNYSQNRLAYFQEELRRIEITPQVYESPHHHAKRTPEAEQYGLLDEAKIGAWLRALPRPLALLCCNDIRAQQVMNICHSEGIIIPDDVAVMGVDDDDVISPLCDPPLTSVRPNAEQIGFEAAQALERMMNGGLSPPSLTLVPPVQVTERQSTQVHAVDDTEVARACLLIRLHACDGMNVGELCNQLSISRRQLERRFRQALGTTPAREITRHQIERVQSLLLHSDLTLEKISDLTGFSYPERLSYVFKRTTGETPGTYRKKNSPE